MRRLRFFVLCAALHMLVLAVAALPAADDGATLPKTFELTVVGPDQKAVAGAEMEVRTRPPLRAEDIQQGQRVRAGEYWASVKADGNGQLLINLPNGLTGLAVSSTTA